MLDVRGLSLSLGEFTLDGVDLTVGDAEYFIILGPTGAGKTILLETIAGIYTPAAGTISLDGRDITRTGPKDRDRRILPGLHALSHLTVEENIGFGLLQKRGSRPDREVVVGETADLLGIGHLLALPEHSQAAKQRLRSRALVLRPVLLWMNRSPRSTPPRPSPAGTQVRPPGDRRRSSTYPPLRGYIRPRRPGGGDAGWKIETGTPDEGR